MASSSPAPSNASAPAPRASGRVRKQTEHFAPSPAVSTSKRKRDAEGEADDGIDEEEDDEDEDDDDEQPDEEELREQKKRNRKPKSSAPRKPAAKKPKTNGTTLPIRSNNTAPKKKAPRKVKLNDEAAKEAGGLYASVLASNDPIEQIIADWLKRFEEKNSSALAEVVNFGLQCIGSDLKVDEHAIEDPDGATNKIDDLREEYQATNPTDYPLIVKGQKANAIKNGLATFFQTLIETISANGMIAEEPALVEHLHVWFSAMSSAPNRPFRHTATVISLNVITALCKCAHENAKGLADDRKHAETEAAKPRANKARVKQLQDKTKAKAALQEMYDSLVKDWFNTVFVHRYRDVDPVIRQESIAALGEWTITHPDVFFDGAHLRYFGWMLGDHNANTRCEVVKQLLRLYNSKTMLGGLRTFTEKFRPRMVEIATNDAETNVRVPCIELLDRLRANGMLEPDDIDAVGRLVFDTDLRIRKAVAGFFAANVVDSYDSKVDDLGGLESLQESLPDAGEDAFDTLRLEWLKLKALAEMLGAYDYDEELPSQISRSRSEGGYLLDLTSSGSRFMLAAEVLYDNIEEIQSWQAIAGYLLFDHSPSKKANGSSRDPLAQMKQECVITDKEEMILLEVLNASVKRSLTDIAEKLNAKAKAGKREKQDLLDEQESTAHGLATLIPQLLKKFGDTPSAAASVLRMESVLNLPSLKDLRQDSETYAALLDDVRKQFMSHSTDEVLAPASNAILHAKSYGELDDLTEEKLNGLWEDVISNFSELINVKTLTVRGSSQSEELVALSNNLRRICRLVQVSDPTTPLEDDNVQATHKQTGEKYTGAIDFLVGLIQRGKPATGLSVDEEEAALEDQISILAAESALFYFRWKVRAVIAAVSESTSTGYADDDLINLAQRRDQYVDALKSVVESRRARENISARLTGCILDIFTSAAILKEVEARPNISDDFTVLACEFDEAYEKLILKTFSAHEKNYARLSGKKLERRNAAADDDEDDEDILDDPLSDSDSDNEEATQSQQPTQKIMATLLAERDLCALTGKMIQAVFAAILKEKAVRKRLERNKAKLGPNFKECVAYLDEKKASKGKKKGGKKAAAAATVKKHDGGKKKSAKSSAIVVEDEEMDDEIEDDDEEELAARGLDDRPNEEVVDDDDDEEEHGNGHGDVEMEEEEESVLGD